MKKIFAATYAFCLALSTPACSTSAFFLTTSRVSAEESLEDIKSLTKKVFDFMVSNGSDRNLKYANIINKGCFLSFDNLGADGKVLYSTTYDLTDIDVKIDMTPKSSLFVKESPYTVYFGSTLGSNWTVKFSMPGMQPTVHQAYLLVKSEADANEIATILNKVKPLCSRH